MFDRLRKYGEATTFVFSLYEVDGVDLRVDASHESGDSTVMKDEGTPANTGSGFVDEGNSYSIALTATEMECARGVIIIIDQTATKAWLDITIEFETYGDASAQHAFDLDTADQIVASVSGAVASVTAAVETDSASRTASQANVSALALEASLFDHTSDEVTTDSASRTASQATGFSTHSAADVWTATTRTLSSFGTLLADIWSYATRVLTGTVETDTASRTASKADVSALALEASLFDHTTDEVITDTASRNASKADVSGLALEATVIARTLLAAGYFDPDSDSVDVGKLLGTLITETNAGDVAESFSFFYDVEPVTTKTVNDVGVAGSGLTAQQVWEYATRILTAAVETDTASRTASQANVSALALEASIDELKGSGFLESTDSNEAIRDRGDDAWLTGAGGSSPTVEEIRTEMETNGGKLDHLWETTEDDAGVRRFTQNGLEQAPIADVSNLDVAVSTRSSHSAADVWAATTRTLSSFGTLIADIWSNVARTITGTVTTDSASRTASQANVSALALEASLFDHTTDEVITDTASRNASKADVSGMALDSTVAKETTLDGVETKVDAIPTVMRGTDDANIVIPDIAGTAATLHGTTDGKIDATQVDITTLLARITANITTKAEMDAALALLATLADQAAMELIVENNNKILKADEQVISNQLIKVDSSDHTTPLQTFDLFKAGVPSDVEPDQRVGT